MDDMDDDNVDMSELEANLYAQIHHDAPESVEQYSPAQKLQQQQRGGGGGGTVPPQRVVTSNMVVNNPHPNSSAGTVVTKRGRYWSDVTTGGGSNFPRPAHNAQSAGDQPRKRVNPFAGKPQHSTPPISVADSPQASTSSTASSSAPYRPKPFTPYTSYLSQIGSPCLEPASPSAAVTTSTTASPPPPPPLLLPTTTTTTTTIATATISPPHQATNPPASVHRAINPAAVARAGQQPRNNHKSQRNKQNAKQPAQTRRSGEHTAGQLQQLDRARQQHEQEVFQRGSAVLRLAQGKLKRSQALRARQERAAIARAAHHAVGLPPPTAVSPIDHAPKKPVRVSAVIDLDSDAADDTGDDDDVICIPVPPPPLVCIDSSEDETAAGDPETSASTNPDPEDGDESSNAEDFVGQRDRNRLSQCLDDADDAAVAEAMDAILDSDAEVACTTVEAAIRAQNQQDEPRPAGPAASVARSSGAATTAANPPPPAARSPVPPADDNSMFATPKRSRTLASEAAALNRSYEVADNQFAAVDIYESESSDFPESVYEKGRPAAAEQPPPAANADTDSDVSSIQLNTANRAKRLQKRRKSAGSNRGSDQRSSVDEPAAADPNDTSDDDEDDSAELGPAFADILRPTSTPYLQRGEAVANAKSKLSRVPTVPASVSKRRRSLSTRRLPATAEEQSDDEFMSMLSCIVHDDKASPPPEQRTSTAAKATALDSSAEPETPEKTIDARAIVENVLSKVAASKSAKKAAKGLAASASGASAARQWRVTDEVTEAAAAAAVPAAAAASDCGRGGGGGEQNDASTPARKKRTASTEGKSLTAGNFFVLDSVGETDEIAEIAEIADVQMVDDGVVASMSSTSAARASRKRPATGGPAADEAEAESVVAAVAGAAEDSNDDNASVRSCSLVVADDPELGWNEEMRSFYNESWGGEEYSQSEIMRAMPKNRFHWTISEADVFPSSPQQTRRFGRLIKCHNCREDGHRAAECFMPPKQVRCYMCGQAGHREPRCPNTICLRCGNKTKMFNRGCTRCNAMSSISCPLCMVKGHTSRDCPDKWRRYHSTTKPNTPLTKLPVLLNKPKYCCVCASPGHSAEYCRLAFRTMDYSAQPMKIQSYEAAYSPIDPATVQPNGAQHEDVAPFAMFSEPLPAFNFQWNVNEAPDRIYGRMMSATKFQRPVFRKQSKKRKKTRSESAAGGGDKKPRTADGERLVLNPLSALSAYRQQNEVVASMADEGAEVEEEAKQIVEEVADVVQSLDESAIEQDATIDSSVDDAFAADIDIDAVDEAVRKHLADTVEPNCAAAETADDPTEAAKAVKSFKVTVANESGEENANIVANRIVVSSEIVLEPGNNKETELAVATAASVSAGTSSVAFSFITALDKIVRPKSQFDIACLPERAEKNANLTGSSEIAPESTIAAATPDKRMDSVSAASTSSAAFSFVSALDEIARFKPQFDIACLPEPSAAQRIVAADDKRPHTPPLPKISHFAEAAEKKKLEMEREMRRLDKADAYLTGLKNELTDAAQKKKEQRTRRTSERVAVDSLEDAAIGYHVVLNEDIDEAAAAEQLSAELSGGGHDSDSNYSFSEYFTKPPETPKKSPVSGLATPLPDFIPIGGDEALEDSDSEYGDIYDETAGLNRSLNLGASASAAAPDASEEDVAQCSEAKIYLSKDHSKYLMTRQGTVFLNDTYTKHGVKLRMEWCSIGNILIVKGRPLAQDNFHADLLAYCTRVESDLRKKQEISQQVPKNRHTLIRFIKEQIGQLERPMGSVRECFQRMQAAEQQRTKTGAKNADRARKQLNMILLGQTGLREGAMHLTALQSNLRCLVETEKKDTISTVFRNEVFQHFKYIFSSVSHDNYGEMVKEYEVMRKAGALPPLPLDRKLLGLKITVAPAVAVGGETARELASGGTAVDEKVTDTSVATTVASNATPKKCIGDGESAANAEVSSTLSASTSNPIAGEQTPKKPHNSFAKALAVTASAKKSAQQPRIGEREQNAMSDEAIVSELDRSLSESHDTAEESHRRETSAAIAPDAPHQDGRHPDACASALWSLKCQQYIDKCRAIPKIQNSTNAMDRLKTIELKARDNRLSYTDYRMLMKIFDQCI